MRARLHGNYLRFFKEDGWERTLLESLLLEGELLETSTFYQLPPSKRGHFDDQRLSEVISEVTLSTGRNATDKERRVVVKYFSQVGLFLHGDRETQG